MNSGDALWTGISAVAERISQSSVRLGQGGTRLHLADDAVYCKPCFHTIAGATQAQQRRANAETNAQHYPQDFLFKL